VQPSAAGTRALVFAQTPASMRRPRQRRPKTRSTTERASRSATAIDIVRFR
jgi:hypothetical protein